MPAMKCLDCNARWYRMGYGDGCPDCRSGDIEIDTDPVEDDPEDDESDDWFDRCGRTPDGTCMLAGTEECDFECPYRDE